MKTQEYPKLVGTGFPRFDYRALTRVPSTEK